MDNIDIILKYFPYLSASQKSAFELLGPLYSDWNSKINVISRSDIDNLYAHHVLHSLAIAAFLGPLQPGTKILDLGTGGGFPGIPLAIFYPEVEFTLIDRIAKKIRVTNAVAEAVGLKNVVARQGDSGEIRTSFDFVVSRAVMPLDGLIKAAAKNVTRQGLPGNKYAPGIVCLKGGDLAQEIAAVKRPIVDFPITEFFNEDFYATKSVVYVPFK